MIGVFVMLQVLLKTLCVRRRDVCWYEEEKFRWAKEQYL